MVVLSKLQKFIYCKASLSSHNVEKGHVIYTYV